MSRSERRLVRDDSIHEEGQEQEDSDEIFVGESGIFDLCPVGEYARRNQARVEVPFAVSPSVMAGI